MNMAKKMMRRRKTAAIIEDSRVQIIISDKAMVLPGAGSEELPKGVSQGFGF